MKVTIKDVAKAAGVSVASTSYALNNSGPVSEEKRQKILEAAKSMGYVPNGMARSLQSKKMGFVGYFAYALSGAVFGEIIHGAEDAFLELNQEMIACSCAPGKQEVTRLLSEKMVDGAIIFVEHIEDELIERIASADCPIVVLDREKTGKYISSILINNFESAYEVGRYMANMQYRSIGYITGSGYDGEQRKKGFLKAVEDFHLPVQENCILKGEFQSPVAYREMNAWLEDKTHTLPEVIFAFDDEMAIATIKALQKNGYSVPKDVSVIGIDDIAIANLMEPRLTTVHRPLYELGRLAAETLYDMMQNGTEGSSQLLSTYLVERTSCKKYITVRDHAESEKMQI